MAILPIVEVIPPNTDRPVLAAFANTPDKPFILPAKTPINPPALVKALLMIELNEFAFFPIIPNPVPSSPKSVKAGPKANAPTNPAMAGVRLLTASCALDIWSAVNLVPFKIWSRAGSKAVSESKNFCNPADSLNLLTNLSNH